MATIKVLKGLEAVRMNPGMYIGSTDEKGLHQLLWEVIDNSVDEALQKETDKIEVFLEKDGRASVRDYGRGIPVEIHPDTGVSSVETVLTVLHAGGKFTEEAYHFSGGMHGVGISVVNALSKKLFVEVKRDGFCYRQEYEDQKPLAPLEKCKKTKERGTFISFLPDDAIFPGLSFSSLTIRQKLRELSYINPGVSFVFWDKRSGKKETFFSKKGLDGYLEYLNRNGKMLGKICHFQKTARDEASGKEVDIECAISYNQNYTEEVIGLVNSIRTPEGGTHVQGLKNGVTKALNEYARKRKWLKENENSLLATDLREGLLAICSVKFSRPEMEGQTKTKLGTAFVLPLVTQASYEAFWGHLTKNEKLAREIIQKALLAKKARIEAGKAREIARKVSKKKTTLPGKLADCRIKDNEKTEIFIVEGDSAGGSAKLARDSSFQAVLPIRGKTLNVLKVSKAKAMSDEMVSQMAVAFGTGILDDFDMSKRRYGKIILMADADVDGLHINTLLLAFLYYYMRPLIEEGYVYLSNPPLYRLTNKTETLYLDTDKELEELKKNKKKFSSYKINRFKGLGEMNAAQLWDTTMNPEKRRLTKIQISDFSFQETGDAIELLMGSKVEPRREFIMENASEVFGEKEKL